jgi:hypothetical protein
MAAALGVGGVKTWALLGDWQSHQGKIDTTVQAMKTLPAGSTLFAATAAPYTSMWLSAPGVRATWHPPLKHVASYASVVGSVFVPMTFADPHKQPMVMLPAYRAVKDLQGDSPFKVPRPADLVAVAQRLTDAIQKPDAPRLGAVFLLVVGTDRYPTQPVLAGFEVFLAGEGFMIFRASAPATAAASKTRPGEAQGG